MRGPMGLALPLPFYVTLKGIAGLPGHVTGMVVNGITMHGS